MIESNYEKTAAFPVTPQTGVEDMNRLLRGEISAAEAFQQVMAKIAADPEAIRLQEFLDDHNNAVSYWKAQVSSEGAVADTSSGAWGTAVETFVGTAKLLGNTAALAALKEGEEHGLNQYEELLDNAAIAEDCKTYVRDFLIPNQRKHVTSLEAMMKVQ